MKKRGQVGKTVGWLLLIGFLLIVMGALFPKLYVAAGTFIIALTGEEQPLVRVAEEAPLSELGCEGIRDYFKNSVLPGADIVDAYEKYIGPRKCPFKDLWDEWVFLIAESYFPKGDDLAGGTTLENAKKFLVWMDGRFPEEKGVVFVDSRYFWGLYGKAFDKENKGTKDMSGSPGAKNIRYKDAKANFVAVAAPGSKSKYRAEAVFHLAEMDINFGKIGTERFFLGKSMTPKDFDKMSEDAVVKERIKGAEVAAAGFKKYLKEYKEFDSKKQYKAEAIAYQELLFKATGKGRPVFDYLQEAFRAESEKYKKALLLGETLKRYSFVFSSDKVDVGLIDADYKRFNELLEDVTPGMLAGYELAWNQRLLVDSLLKGATNEGVEKLRGRGYVFFDDKGVEMTGSLGGKLPAKIYRISGGLTAATLLESHYRVYNYYRSKAKESGRDDSLKKLEAMRDGIIGKEKDYSNMDYLLEGGDDEALGLIHGSCTYCSFLKQDVAKAVVERKERLAREELERKRKEELEEKMKVLFGKAQLHAVHDVAQRDLVKLGKVEPQYDSAVQKFAQVEKEGKETKHYAEAVYWLGVLMVEYDYTFFGWEMKKYATGLLAEEQFTFAGTYVERERREALGSAVVKLKVYVDELTDVSKYTRLPVNLDAAKKYIAIYEKLKDEQLPVLAGTHMSERWLNHALSLKGQLFADQTKWHEEVDKYVPLFDSNIFEFLQVKKVFEAREARVGGAQVGYKYVKYTNQAEKSIVELYYNKGQMYAKAAKVPGVDEKALLLKAQNAYNEVVKVQEYRAAAEELYDKCYSRQRALEAVKVVAEFEKEYPVVREKFDKLEGSISGAISVATLNTLQEGLVDVVRFIDKYIGQAGSLNYDRYYDDGQFSSERDRHGKVTKLRDDLDKFVEEYFRCDRYAKAEWSNAYTLDVNSCKQTWADMNSRCCVDEATTPDSCVKKTVCSEPSKCVCG